MSENGNLDRNKSLENLTDPETTPITKPEAELDQTFDSEPEAIPKPDEKLAVDFETAENRPIPKPDIEINPLETEQSVEVEAEKAAEEILSDRDQLLSLIEEEFKEDFDEIRRQFEGDPEYAEQLIEEARTNLLEKLEGPKAKGKLGKAFSFVAKRFGVPAIAGGALRGVVKNSARAYLGWQSFGASVGLGAIIGGTWAGVDTWRKERKKLDESEVIIQLNDAINSKDNVKTAAIIDKARKYLKSGKVFPLEANAIKVKLQRAEIDLRLVADKENLEHLSPFNRFMSVVEESRHTRQDLRKLEGIKHEKLEHKIKFEMKKNPEFRKKLAINVIVGTVSGALGGAAGYGIHQLIDSGYIGELLGRTPTTHATEKVADKVVDKVAEGTTTGLTTENLTEVATTQSHEVFNAHSQDILDSAQRELMEAKFAIIAQKGDGATNAARDLIHDFLVNKENITGGAHHELTQEQIAKLVYAEDMLKNQLLDHTSGAEHIVQPGQAFELTGGQIEEVWEKADALSPEQIANITKMLATPEHHLSSETLAFMNSEALHNTSNEIWEEIMRHAREQATEVVKNHAVDTLGLEAAHGSFEAAPKGFTDSLEESAKKVLINLAIGGAVLGGAYVGTKAAQKGWRAAKASWNEGNEGDMDIETGETNEAEKYWEEDENLGTSDSPEAESTEERSYEDIDADIHDKYGVAAVSDRIEKAKLLPYIVALEKLLPKSKDKLRDKYITFTDKGDNKFDDFGAFINIEETNPKEFSKWLKAQIKDTPDHAPEPTPEPTDDSSVDSAPVENSDDLSFEDLESDLKDKYDFKIVAPGFDEMSDTDKERMQEYLVRAHNIVRRNQDYFKGKKLFFTDQGRNSVVENEFYIDPSTLTPSEFNDWFKDYSDAYRASERIKKKLADRYQVDIKVHEKVTKKARKYYPVIEAAVKASPAIFKEKSIFVGNLTTKEEESRIVINADDDLDSVKEFLNKISTVKPESNDIDWSSALSGNSASKPEQSPSPSKSSKEKLEHSGQMGSYSAVESIAKKREKGKPNEDTFFVDEESGLIAVFDGAGGSSRPDLASSKALEVIKRDKKKFDNLKSVEEVGEALTGILQTMQNEIQAEVKKQGAGESYAAGVIGKVWKDLASGKRFFVGTNIGDSRLYLDHGNGAGLEPITWDLSEEMRSYEQRLREVSTKEELSKEEDMVKALFGKRHFIDDSLGHSGQKIDPDIYHFELGPKDKIIATSDGIHDNLTDKEIAKLIKGKSATEIPNILTAAAYDRSQDKDHLRAKPDDITAAVLEVPEQKKPLSELSKDEIDAEAKEKGLNPGAKRFWFDAMRLDGGLFKDVETGDRPLDTKEVSIIREALRDIESFKSKNGTADFRHNVEILTPAYEILLTKFDQTRDDKDNHFFMSTILGTLRKIDKDLITAVENSVLKHKFKESREKFGLNNR